MTAAIRILWYGVHCDLNDLW